jgi:hypothetical protein
MKQLVFALAAIAVLGCSDVHQDEQDINHDVTHIEQQQDAISAAVKKIQVVSGASVKGGSDYDMLGPVEGYCFNLPNSTSGQVVHGDGLRTAAYRKYGDQVNAIVNTTIWFVSDDESAAYEPYTENGYFECGGIAVHFNGNAAAAPLASSHG